MSDSAKKKTSAVTAVILMAALLFTGTWAWSSLNQDIFDNAGNKMYAGGRLHQDFFLTRDKDSKLRSDASIYVENYMTGTDAPLITRVMIREYLESGSHAGKNIDKTKTAREAEIADGQAYAGENLNYAIYGMEVNDPSTWKIHKYGETVEENPIREYLNFEYGDGGVQRAYMPTFNKVMEQADSMSDVDNEGLLGDATNFAVADADQKKTNVQNFTKLLMNQPDVNGTVYGAYAGTTLTSGVNNFALGSLIYDPVMSVDNMKLLNNFYTGYEWQDEDAGNNIAGTTKDLFNAITNIKRTQRYTDYVRYTVADIPDTAVAGFTTANLTDDTHEAQVDATKTYSNYLDLMQGAYLADTPAGSGVKELDVAGAATLGSYVAAVTQSTGATKQDANDVVPADYQKVNMKVANEYFVRDGELMCREAVHYAKQTPVQTTNADNDKVLDGIMKMSDWQALYDAYKTAKETFEAVPENAGKNADEEDTATQEAKAKLTGDFWVYDEDGWAYYAKTIAQGGNASSLLTHSMTEGEKLKQLDQWYYAQDVTAQFADPASVGSENDHTAFYQQNGVVSNQDDNMQPSLSAERLMNQIGANIVGVPMGIEITASSPYSMTTKDPVPEALGAHLVDAYGNKLIGMNNVEAYRIVPEIQPYGYTSAGASIDKLVMTTNPDCTVSVSSSDSEYNFASGVAAVTLRLYKDNQPTEIKLALEGPVFFLNQNLNTFALKSMVCVAYPSNQTSGCWTYMSMRPQIKNNYRLDYISSTSAYRGNANDYKGKYPYQKTTGCSIFNQLNLDTNQAQYFKSVGMIDCVAVNKRIYQPLGQLSDDFNNYFYNYADFDDSVLQYLPPTNDLNLGSLNMMRGRQALGWYDLFSNNLDKADNIPGLDKKYYMVLDEPIFDSMPNVATFKQKMIDLGVWAQATANATKYVWLGSLDYSSENNFSKNAILLDLTSTNITCKVVERSMLSNPSANLGTDFVQCLYTMSWNFNRFF